MESSKKNRRLQAILIMMAFTLIIQSGCADTDTPADTSGLVNEYSKSDEVYDAGLKSASGFSLVEENGEVQLYVNGKTAEIAVKNKSTGAMWYSNPVDRASDTIAVSTNMQELSSQVKVEYFNSKIKKTFFNTSNDSISLGQYSFYKIPDGLRVNFGLGYIPIAYTVPRVLSIERMQEIQTKLSDEDKASLESYYTYLSLDYIESETDKAFYISALPICKTRDVYYLSILSLTDPSLNDKLSDYIMSKVQALLDKAGYTEADYASDNSDNLIVIAEVENSYMEMSIEYTLDGADLIADVPPESIKYDGRLMTVTRISLLPYFGAAGLAQEGYIFVPDGSGALVNLNNGKTNYEAYNKPVYGRDHSIFIPRLSQHEDSQIYLPVFGLKQGEEAFLAIIEGGDAVADINLGTSGVINNYNNVYAAFNIKNTAQELRSTLNIAGFLNFQKKPLQSDIRIRYTFLQGDQADYTGMALRYQKYLLDHQLIEKQPAGGSLPVAINLIGAVPDTVSVLGIPRKSQKPVTTFVQAKAILEELRRSGIERVHLQYSSWCNNGIKNTVSDKVDLIRSLGSRKDFAALNEYAQDNDVSVYPDLNFVHATGNAFYELLTEKRQAARDLGNSVIQDYEYNIATLYYIDDGSNTIISPRRYGEIFRRFLKDFAVYGTDGLSLSTLGHDLNADYNKKLLTDRQMAKEIVADELGALSEEGLNLSFDGANAYVLRYADMLFGVPTDSSNYYIFDRTVPFYQIVLHGILPYAGEPLNLSGDMEYDALKMIETGTLPSFEWMYAQNSELKESDADYFALSYSDWIGWAKAFYEQIGPALSDCQDSTIAEHEMLQEDVYQTVYSNGTRIAVNYGGTAVTVGGTVVGPMDFEVIR